MLESWKKSPPSAFWIVIPILGKNAVVDPPKRDVPVKNGFAKVTN